MPESKGKRKINRDGVNGYLSSKCLDALSAIRNLIVHKGGVADDAYKACVDRNVGLPLATEGEVVILDGAYVGKLITEFVDACLKLTLSIDEWISDGAENG